MIRMLLAVALTLLALVGLGLRLARDADVRPESEPSPEVRTRDLGEAVAAGGPSGAPSPAEESAGPASVPAPRPEVVPRAAVKSAAPRSPVPSSPAAPAPVAPPDVELDVVEERIAGDAWFREAPLDASGEAVSGSGGNEIDDGAPPPARLASSADQDAWADLIRRMLALYRRTGERR